MTFAFFPSTSIILPLSLAAMDINLGLSLINQLPTEILIEIFSTCFINDPVYTPLSLSSICRLWRDIILTSPRLWTFILINGGRSIGSCLKQARIWLARSKPLYFDVDFKLSQNSNSDSDGQDALLPLMSPFLPYLSRWRHCHISFHHAHRIRFESIKISSLYQPGLDPVLHYLNLTVQPNEEGGAAPLDSTLGNNLLPTLYSCGASSSKPQHISMNISLASLPTPEHLHILPFTALNIMEVSLEVYLHPFQILQFLRACPLLEQLFFSGGPHTEESPLSFTLPTVNLIHLRTLLIRNTSFQRTLLSHLHTPVLRELHLQNLNLDFELPSVHDDEEGDSEEEFPDYSQSPWSDHHTGAYPLSLPILPNASKARMNSVRNGFTQLDIPLPSTPRNPRYGSIRYARKRFPIRIRLAPHSSQIPDHRIRYE